jgi:sugar phosphate isomerase/epimerase
MLYGAPAASVKELNELRAQGFHFAEISIPNPAARHMWWESGIKNTSENGFFLLAHGPLEDPSRDDVRYLRDHYIPGLMATVDTSSRMRIKYLTIHMSVDKRLISGLHLAEKILALKELVAYAQGKDVVIGLENVTESAFDLEPVLDAVPGLCLTLDIGHAQLGPPLNNSVEIVKRLGPAIRHLHVHDNREGVGQADDLHLPVGEGIIDFPTILKALIGRGYKGTMTLEMKPHELLRSRNRIQQIIDEILIGESV